MLLTGERWRADDARRWGMVQEVVAPGEQVACAMGYARKIADCAPLGVQGVLHSTRSAQVEDHDAAVAEMYKRLVPVMASADAAEGVHSFMERRKAVFTGHSANQGPNWPTQEAVNIRGIREMGEA